jgi:homoserine kinase
MIGDVKTAHVRIPATSANLGAGFDCIGIAVDRGLSAWVEADDDPRSDSVPINIRRDGALSSLAIAPEDDMLYAGFIAACAAAGRSIPAHLSFVADSDIPVGRGLGSSSAALVAGASLADDALSLGLGPIEIAQMCTRIEGHPDNVGPAIFGGAILAVPDHGSGDARRWVFAPVPVHPDLAFIFIIPPFTIETAAARAILPREVSYDIAVTAAGKGAALVHALVSGDSGLLRVALDDVLHVPYRRELVRGMGGVHNAASAAGAYGVTLSGSGPTLVAVAPQESADRVADAMKNRWNADGVSAESFVQRQPAIVP